MPPSTPSRCPLPRRPPAQTATLQALKTQLRTGANQTLRGPGHGRARPRPGDRSHSPCPQPGQELLHLSRPTSSACDQAPQPQCPAD